MNEAAIANPSRRSEFKLMKGLTGSGRDILLELSGE
jgi:hypothetical protein